MIGVYDWSYTIDKKMLRITFNDTIQNKIILMGKRLNAIPLPQIKGKSNEIYFAFKTEKALNDFIVAMLEAYPNSFTLENEWDIAQTSTTDISFTSFTGKFETPQNFLQALSSRMSDMTTITKLTNASTKVFDCSQDLSEGFVTFTLSFKTSEAVQEFITAFNKLKK